MQLPFFDNLGLRRSANSCKRIAFTAGVRKKPGYCRVLKKAKRTLNFMQIITQLETFFLCNFCQTYTPSRHQSLKHCNGKIHFLFNKRLKLKGSNSNFFQNIYVTHFFSCSQLRKYHSSHSCDTILFSKSTLRSVYFHQKKFLSVASSAALTQRFS